MAIGSPPITWDLNIGTGEMWLYIGTSLPNSSGKYGRDGMYVF